MKTKSLVNTKSIMPDQVAGSRNIEWMVNSYNAWQQRSPLQSVPKRSIPNLLQLVKVHKVKQLFFK